MGDVYVGVNGQRKKVIGIWIGVNGQAKKIKNAWVGVGNQPKVVYTSLGVPVVLYCTNSGTVTWQAATGASYYRVKKYQNGSWVYGSSTTDTSYTLLSIGRSVTKVGVTAYDGNGNYTISEDYDLSWIQITFDGNGGTPSESSKYMITGNTIESLPTATRTSYRFQYWMNGSTSGSRVYTSTRFSEAAILYAKWVLDLDRPVIRGVDNDGTVHWDFVSGASSYRVLKYTSSWATSLYTTNNQLKLASFTTSTSSLKVRAYVTSNGSGDYVESYEYPVYWITITFNGNGGTPSESSRTIVEGNSLGTLPTATRSGYNFTGWYLGKGSQSAKVTANTAFSSDGEIYAHWTSAVVYVTVTYNGNGGTPTKSSDTVESGSRIVTANCTRNSDTSGTVCYKYTGDGWYTSASGGSFMYDFLDYANPTEDMDLYAHWISTAYLKVPTPISVTRGSKNVSFRIYNPSGKTIYYRFYKTVNGTTWYQEPNASGQSIAHKTTSDGVISATLNFTYVSDMHYYTICISDGSRSTWCNVTLSTGGEEQPVMPGTPTTQNGGANWVQPVDDPA